MYGQRLDVEAHIITVASSAIANVSKVVEAAGVQVDDVVLQPLASAEAVLTAEERRQGVVVADIGGGCTDICVFVEGSIQHTATAAHRRQPHHARPRGRPALPLPQRRSRQGGLRPRPPQRRAHRETIDIEAFGAERQRTYPRRLVCEIIQARCEEILEMIVNEVEVSPDLDLVSAGLVLTGGTARLPASISLAEQVTGMPARIGLPSHIFGLVDELHDPAFATSVGLLQWAMGDQDLAPLSQGPLAPAPSMASSSASATGSGCCYRNEIEMNERMRWL